MTDSITVKAPEQPKLINFSPTQTNYAERGAGNAGSTDGIIRLNWNIANANQIAELQVLSLAPDGTPKGQPKRYSFAAGALPAELRTFCQMTTNLVCQNVPTDAQQVGDYIFRLLVIPRQGQPVPEQSRDTGPIQIQAQKLEITSFTVNGEDVRNKPKHIFSIPDGFGPIEIYLAWQVKGGTDLVVELLPAPGPVELQGTKSYQLGVDTSETLTLKVSNKAGQQEMRSVVIQTKAVRPIELTIPSPTPGATPGSGSESPNAAPASPPFPNNSAPPAPIELPPQAN